MERLRRLSSSSFSRLFSDLFTRASNSPTRLFQASFSPHVALVKPPVLSYHHFWQSKRIANDKNQIFIPTAFDLVTLEFPASSPSNNVRELLNIYFTSREKDCNSKYPIKTFKSFEIFLTSLWIDSTVEKITFLEIVYYAPWEKKVYFASVKFDARAKKRQ